MLNKKQTIVASVLGVLIVLGIIGGEMVTGSQATRMKSADKAIKDGTGPEAIEAAKGKKKALQKMKVEVVKWKKLLSKAEKLFPKTAHCPLSNDVVAGLMPASASVQKCDKGGTTQISWSPPKKAEGGDSDNSASDDDSDTSAKKSGIGYEEEVVNIQLKGDYQTWMEFLGALEETKAFYRLKEFSMKTAGTGNESTLTIDTKLASYRIIEPPPEPKGEKKDE